MSNVTTLIAADTLVLNSRRILEAAGVPPKQSETIAMAVVEADLRGIGSHGVLRLPAYVHRALTGTMTATTELKVLRERGGTALLDAQNGFGQVAGVHAMQEAISRAERFGIGFVGVRNSGHFGIAAYYAMLALRHHMIGMVLANSAPCMAAWGGMDPLLGTNPICIAIPTGEEVDIVLDMASSVVARGKIRLAEKKGEQIPEAWALDAQGRPTSDPAAAMKGTLLPIGGPKGYGLALSVDVLSGVLTGSCFGRHVASSTDFEREVSAGFVMQAIDIAAFADLDVFNEDIQELISDIRSSSRAPGVERIFLPGEIEWQTKQERLFAGIPVANKVLAELQNLATELKVEFEMPTPTEST